MLKLQKSFYQILSLTTVKTGVTWITCLCHIDSTEKHTGKEMRHPTCLKMKRSLESIIQNRMTCFGGGATTHPPCSLGPSFLPVCSPVHSYTILQCVLTQNSCKKLDDWDWSILLHCMASKLGKHMNVKSYYPVMLFIVIRLKNTTCPEIGLTGLKPGKNFPIPWQLGNHLLPPVS